MRRYGGYRWLERVHLDGRWQFWRALRERDGRRVLIKLARDDAERQESTALRHELDVLSSIDGGYVLQLLDIEPFGTGEILILDDFGGRPLRDVAPLWSGVGRHCPLDQAVPVLLGLVHGVESVHRAQWMHGSIRPDTVWVSDDGERIALGELCDARPLYGKGVVPLAEVASVHRPYMAPELTGLTEGAIDHRADLYALGVLFYEILVGFPPFDTGNLLVDVHAQLARRPSPPHAIVSSVPTPLSEVIIKLLHKDPAQRYQSASGLRADLEVIRRAWTGGSPISLFPPGKRDAAAMVPSHLPLVGRNSQVAEMTACLERISAGASEALLLVGPAGIGKTTLLEALAQEATARGALLANGKFDQFSDVQPMSAVLRMFGALIQHTLSATEEEMLARRQRLMAALAGSADVLAQMIPASASLLGPRPEPAPLPAAEAIHRSHHVIRRVIRSYLEPDRPLVMMLDDLHWADPASVEAVGQMIEECASGGLLWVGAHRSPEASPAGSLDSWRRRIEAVGVRCTISKVEPLDESAFQRLLLEIFGGQHSQSDALATFLHDRTGGNPLLFVEYLRTLQAEGVFSFDSDRERWTWDVNEVLRRVPSDDIADMLASRLGSLGAETRRMMGAAAALGSEFDLDTLQLVTDLPVEQIDESLSESITAGLVIRAGGAAQYPEPASAETARFTHDRIQQAAYALNDEARRSALHWRIGTLLGDLMGRGFDDRLFVCVDHLNRGRQAAATTEERLVLARRNLAAARSALVTGAKASSASYAQAGMGALDGRWDVDPDTMATLCLTAAEAAYLEGRFDDMEQHLATFEGHADTDVMLARASAIRIQALAIRNMPRAALAEGLAILRRFGIDLPESPTPEAVEAGLDEVQALIGDRSIESLAELPRMVGPDRLAASRILSAIASPAHMANPGLFPLIVANQAILSIRHGNTVTSPVAYALMGMLLSADPKRIHEGYRFGQLALSLLEVVDAQRYRAMVIQLVAIGPRHFEEPLRDILPSLREAYQAGLEAGDLPYAGYSAHQICVHTYFAGLPVSETAQTVRELSTSLRAIQQETALSWNLMYEQATLNLLGRSPCPFRLEGEVYDAKAQLPVLVDKNNRSGVATLHVLQMHLAVLHGAFDFARDQAAAARSYLDGLTGLLHVPIFHAFDSLAALCGLDAGAPLEPDTLDRVQSNLGLLRAWSTYAPFHHEHRIALIEAELARVRNDLGLARERYLDAARLGEASDYVQDEAFIHERVAAFFASRGEDLPARSHAEEARRGWARWGAASKTKSVKPAERPERSDSEPPPTPRGVPSNVDLTAIVRATSALSGDVVLDSLLRRVLTTVVEYAGAERGFLLMEQDGKLEVEAWVDPSLERGGEGCPASHSNRPAPMCNAVVAYVERTRRSVVLADASGESVFSQDPYIREHEVRSLLCLPVEARGRLLGVVYLENNLAAGVFGTSRVALLSVLIVQAAVAVENARLYADLEREVDKRTLEIRRANERLQTEVRVRAETEAALRESRQRFLAFMDNLPAPAYLFDDRDVLVYVNRRFEEVMGTGWRGRTLFDHLPRSVAESMTADNRAAREAGVVRRAETVEDLQGVAREYETTKFAIRVPGHPPQVGGLSLDMTDRKRAEEALRYAQKMESLGVLAGGVAHDFNNLLTSVLANVSIVIDDDIGDDHRECLRDALQAGSRAADLAQQMLAYSGHGQFVLDAQELPGLMYKALGLLRSAAPKSARIEMEIDDELPPVLVDRGQFEQLLVNLVTNATEAFDDSPGSVRIMASVVSIAAGDSRYSRYTAQELSPGRYVALDITDDGPGMDASTLDKIFEPFFTTKFTGRGLGLPVVLGIIRGHRGGIEVHSEPGRGTHVRVVLPAASPEPAPSPVPSGHQAVGHTILIIDDEPAVLRVSKRVLERAGYAVLDAADGSAGMALFAERAGEIDAVVLDLSMPGISGSEVLAEMRRARPEVPVLVVSGYSRAEVARRLKGEPPTGVLRKPFRPKELVDALGPVLSVKSP